MSRPPLAAFSSRGIGVVWGIGALLTLNFSIVAATIWLAGSDPSVAVEPDYYRKALTWDDAAQQRRASHRLGWSAVVEHHPASTSTPARLELILHDRAGSPVEQATVRATIFRHVRAGDRGVIDFIEAAPGRYQAPAPGAPAAHASRWRAVIVVRRGLETFTADADFEIGPVPTALNQP